MKNIKKAAIAVIAAVPLMLPLGAIVHAAQLTNLGCDSVVECEPQVPTANLDCPTGSVEFPDAELNQDSCDLSVDKLVSINGGAFVEADTSADAAQAQVGDTVTWKVIVNNESPDELVPTGQLTVNDVLPSGAHYVSSSATAGSYDGTNWTFSLDDNLPATLTITSTAVSTGLFKNTATLSQYDSCIDGCSVAEAYADSDSSNNSNDAWFDPSAKPVVLGATTLVNTGSGTALQTIAAGGLIAATAGTLLVDRRRGYKV